MESSWFVIAIVIIAAICLVFFLAKRNVKDKKELEKQLNEDYEKPKDSGPHI